MNHQVAITDLTQKAEASEELLKELTAKNSRRGLFQKREHQVYEHRRWLLRWTRRCPKWCENAKSSSKWKKQEWKAPANTGPLARFLRYKDVQKIFSLGHRLRETDFQMFSDYPAEIVRRRKEQRKTFKEARKNSIPAFRSVYRNLISYLEVDCGL